MDENDLESFIANIELTAPVDPLQSKLTCDECGGLLEEDEDGHYVCPICCAQATNILQLDETELHQDEQGRTVYGQRVLLGTKKVRVEDYGWTWSVGEAVATILEGQLKALLETNLVTEEFRAGISNMFRLYWLRFVSPHIRDNYHEDELHPINLIRWMKLRDIEVLLKVNDKVMIPTSLVKGRGQKKYFMLGKQFLRKTDSESLNARTKEHETEVQDVVEETADTTSDCGIEASDANTLVQHEEQLASPNRNPMIPINDLKDVASHCLNQTRNISAKSVTILTLNRTLAFLEAISRALPQDDPLFAADIIRACNQRLIPFYGAAQLLPKDMKLNPRDAAAFRPKTLPPTPTQLTRTACLLIAKVYEKQLPRQTIVPNMDTILERFIEDMNLPHALFDKIRGRTSFLDFRATRPRLFTKFGRTSLPQYDRWAFAVLVIHLKDLFNLNNKQIIAQREKALGTSREGSRGNYFILLDWVRQMAMRLELILRYDPFALYHPMCKLEQVVPTAQLGKYIEQIIEDETYADIVVNEKRCKQAEDEDRHDLADVLYRKFRPPTQLDREFFRNEDLEISSDIKHPLTDAIRRTERYWMDRLNQSEWDLVSKSFATTNLILLDDISHWPLFDGFKDQQFGIPSWWPSTLRLLLRVGAFLCFCEPDDLLDELRAIVKSDCRRILAMAENPQPPSPIYNPTNAPRGYGRQADDV